MFNTLKLHMEECLCMTMKCNAQAQHASDLTIRCQWQSQGDAWTPSPSPVLHDIPLNYLRWRVSYLRKHNNCFRFTPTIVQLVFLLE